MNSDRWSESSGLVAGNAVPLRRLRGEGGAGLLSEHVGGVPVGPLFITYAAVACLVFAVRGGGTLQCLLKVGNRCVRRRRGIETAWQAFGDLLEQPLVAVRVAEGDERRVTRGRVGASTDAITRTVVPELCAGGTGMKPLAHFDSASREVVVRGLDVGDDEIKALR